jgi:hypothetical protein
MGEAQNVKSVSVPIAVSSAYEISCGFDPVREEAVAALERFPVFAFGMPDALA